MHTSVGGGGGAERSSAVLPTAVTAAINASGDAWPCIVARPSTPAPALSNSTSTSVTPATSRKARSTMPVQWPQCMPSTRKTIVPEGGGDGGGDRTGPSRNSIMNCSATVQRGSLWAVRAPTKRLQLIGQVLNPA